MAALIDTLRPHLLPLTRSLPAPLPSLGTQLLGSQCYDTLIYNLDLSPDCLKLAISKVLGLGIVASSAVVKVPQILKLQSSQSASGISLLSYTLETAAYIITLAYSFRSGYPFSTYGETLFVAAQNVFVCVLVLRYSGHEARASGFLAVVAAVAYSLYEPHYVDMAALRGLQAGAGVLGAASKVPQIIEIWRQGGTGQLSAFAVFMFCAGSLSRIFTTWQEVDDSMMLWQYVAGFVLNAVIAAQMVFYWSSPATASHAAEIGKEPERIAMGKSSGSSPSKGKGPFTRRRG